MWSEDNTETQSSSGLPSYTTSVRTRSARAVYRRVRKVVWLQWRGITIVVFILVDVIFFSVVFIYLNSAESQATENLEKSMPYLLCLVANPAHREKCFPLGQALFVNQSTVNAILIMLSVSMTPLGSPSLLTFHKAGRHSVLHTVRPALNVHRLVGTF